MSPKRPGSGLCHRPCDASGRSGIVANRITVSSQTRGASSSHTAVRGDHDMSRAASAISMPLSASPASRTESSSVTFSSDTFVPAVDEFAPAADAVLLHLQAVAPLTLWAVVRYDDGDCVFDAVAGSESDGASDVMAAGTRLPWAHLLCSRMVEGRGPRVAPDVRRVPAYASAPLARRLPVGAYV